MIKCAISNSYVHAEYQINNLFLIHIETIKLDIFISYKDIYIYVYGTSRRI